MVSVVNGMAFDVKDNPTLQQHVENGWKWIVLSEDIPDEQAALVSEWRNTDQNTCQIKHEIELIKAIQRACAREASLWR